MAMSNRFRVQSIEIEGFKGFTNQQDIDFKGRHIFLLGQNSKGKSSIIEAIRWGLFGSLNRPNENVQHSSYSSGCRVVITLASNNKQWKLRRIRIQGVSGGSDATLTDENGQEHSIREVIPSLDSLTAGEGTHIIFSSPQSAPLRHQPDDLTPFHRTVLNHVGLLRPQSLHSQLSTFLEEQQDLEDHFDAELSSAEVKIRDDIEYWEQRRSRILSSPPWDSELQPTIGQSESKARDLIRDISGKSPDSSFDSASLDALLQEAERALEIRREQTQGDIQQELHVLIGRREALEKLQEKREGIKRHRGNISTEQDSLKSILDGKSLDELHIIVEETSVALDISETKHRILDNAITLLSKTEADSLSCPVCSTQHTRSDLQTNLIKSSNQLSGDATSTQLTELESQLKQANYTKNQIKNLQTQFKKLEQGFDTDFMAIDEDDRTELSGQLNDIDSLIERLSDRETSLEEQIAGNESVLDALDTRLDKLGEEEEFHRIQKQLQILNGKKREFGLVEDAFQSIVSFGESVKAVHQVVEECFDQRFEEEIPNVSAELSQVFAALTHHPYFDQLKIEKDAQSQRLELRVASSQEPSRAHPSGVLNGQAESALELVPYFTFSRVEGASTEVYLLMLDDPTRAFDKEHIEILVGSLAELGQRVQLVVASHESDLFRDLLPKYFEQDPYVIVEPIDWSFQDGPKLKIDYE